MLYYQRELLQPLLCQQTETVLRTEELQRIERQAQSIEQFKKQISLHLSEYYSLRVCSTNKRKTGLAVGCEEKHEASAVGEQQNDVLRGVVERELELGERVADHPLHYAVRGAAKRGASTIPTAAHEGQREGIHAILDLRIQEFQFSRGNSRLPNRLKKRSCGNPALIAHDFDRIRIICLHCIERCADRKLGELGLDKAF